MTIYTRLRSFNFSFIVLTLAGLGWARSWASETLFSQAVELKTNQEFREIENFFHQKPTSVEEIRKSYSSRKWGPDVSKVELMSASRRDRFPPWIDTNPNIKDNEPYARITYVIDVLFKENLTPDEEKRYKFHYGESRLDQLAEKPVGADQLTALVRRIVRNDPTVLLVEYSSGAGRLEPHDKPFLRIVSRGEDLQAKEEAEKKRKEMLATFAIGKSFGKYEYQEVSAFGPVYESFKRPQGILSVFHSDLRAESHPLHRLIQNCQKPNIKVQRTDYGYVILSKLLRSKIDPNSPDVYETSVAWLDKNNHAFQIYCVSSDSENEAMKLLPHYASKFPSIITENADVDREIWVRNEIGYRLESLRAIIDADWKDNERRFDWTLFHSDLLMIRSLLALPQADELNLKEAPTSAQRLEIFRKVNTFWTATEQNLIYDKATGKLKLRQ